MMIRIYQKLSNWSELKRYPNNTYSDKMDCSYAALNTKGFSSSLENHVIPESDHLTYEGSFNELKFSIGKKAQKPMELYLGYARAQNSESLWDKEVNDYLTIFTKGAKDGEDRDDRVLNAVMILDISGSMGSGLTARGEGCRLELAKEAIMMFVSKLRPTDGFSLVTFNNKGHTIIPMQRVSTLNLEEVSQTIRSIKTAGGTTLITGLQEGLSNLKNYWQNQEIVKPEMFENRLVMLTDVQDNSVAMSQNFISQIEKSHIHTTIIGISDSFRSQVCEKLIEVRGFNYFCATELNDLQKYLFENFSYTFFPSNFDIEIRIENENLQSIEVFGTVDRKKVQSYNANRSDNKFVVTRTETSFPSELELHQNGDVLTYGGLMMVKLKLKNKANPVFEGIVHLTYTTCKGEKNYEQVPFRYESPANQQFYSDEALQEAMDGFFYVFEVKGILDSIQKGTKEQKNQYLSALKNMLNRVPKSKEKELSDLISTIDKSLNSPNEIMEYDL